MQAQGIYNVITPDNGILINESQVLLDEYDRLVTQGSHPSTEQARVNKLRLLVAQDTQQAIFRGMNFIKGNLAPSPLNAARPGTEAFSGMVVDGNDFVSYESVSLFTSGWSNEHAHGADTLTPIMNMVTGILRPGEKIDHILKMVWRKVSASNLKFVFYDQDHYKDSISQQDCSIEGKFLTSDGRIVGFYALEREKDPIKKEIPGISIYPLEALRGLNIVEKDGVFRIGLRELSFESTDVLNKNPSLRASMLIDLITLALVAVYGKAFKDSKLTAAFLTKLENLDLPENIYDVINNHSYLLVRFTRRMKLQGTEFYLQPFLYKFSYSRKPFAKGTIAGTEEINGVNEVNSR